MADFFVGMLGGVIGYVFTRSIIGSIFFAIVIGLIFDSLVTSRAKEIIETMEEDA